MKDDEKKVISWKPGEPFPLEWYPPDILEEFISMDFRNQLAFNPEIQKVVDRYIKKTKPDIKMISTPNPKVEWIMEEMMPKDKIILGQKINGKYVAEINYSFKKEYEGNNKDE